MQRFFYGTFETILYAHVAEISRKDLADILFSSTDIDPKADDAKIQRKDCIDSSLLTRFRSGERKVSPAILEKYRSPSARENVIFWFQTEIVPKIVEFESEPLVQELLALIQRDPFTDEET